MDTSKAEKILIYWLTKDDAAIAAIREYFHLPTYTTVNGWTPGEIQQKDMPMFEETAKRGFFRYRREEWSYNGTAFSW